MGGVWFDTGMEAGNVDLVRQFLRGQNLEQVGRVEEALALYEIAVANDFDSSGPYDRLITIYSHQARHKDVVRVAEAALLHVHTYEDKRAWYERMREEAGRAQEDVPRAAPKKKP
jgi:tetratricopeptide (TPR) repeat protein